MNNKVKASIELIKVAALAVVSAMVVGAVLSYGVETFGAMAVIQTAVLVFLGWAFGSLVYTVWKHRVEELDRLDALNKRNS